MTAETLHDAPVVYTGFVVAQAFSWHKLFCGTGVFVARALQRIGRRSGDKIQSNLQPITSRLALSDQRLLWTR
ncbi:hypothetical protein Pla52o_01060 [Novipirellula galeiformis]|uniref:Uncharacterized protein n=1 Tax=Novipirellula galeiformis TaxID=2528004 RepID=A0A5C6CMU0_9BACT|nr:hypothetical protein Pla52o_01060 [Novipirellula galeiformis]